ncbi:ATP-dependent zinc metalloprotease FtsH [uncultured Roseburia sp.]|uniref:ATP-dependent zinc metalloprotease FtsH n=1 Tax=Brotonthovivens ammoniilytica TaxID=2981725 RepID=A0ABT2TM21_9FIRM|nr:ATP-dependent zinc metalloprotease FtsH [Brotonthovivens ammoniilytica]MCU6763264.1 ATP-dependent zinc metalloprotease FtsH [Brotonthovivens ammoniilytica]SCJ11298.1 ATP-dependent zinc metalloprotease FtsH [uncultured Roseburia sp.]
MNPNQPDNGNRGGNNNKKNGKNGQSLLIFVLVTLIFLMLVSFVSNKISNYTDQEISYTEFLEKVDKGEVKKVEIGTSVIKIEPKESEQQGFYKVTYHTGVLKDETLLERLEKKNVEVSGTIPNNTYAWISSILSFLIPILLLWLVFSFVMRKVGGGAGGMMGVTKNNAKVYVEKSTGVTFKDVAGQDEAKESLQEVVDFLHNPKKYTEIGAKLPKGALLVGPPGTGKTLLAKAVAGEAKVPFFSLAGSDFVEMFVGLGASRVRDLFKEAQKQAPCIIFIDEIDAIGKSRDSHYGGGNDEREQTLNQLLAEMDGFDTSKGLLILAATNRPEVLDKALLRPGRFDRRIIVDKPDLKGRLETLKVHSKNVLMDDTVDLDAIALATAGCVGSDLANMINEAAINAVKHGRRAVNQNDLFEAFEVVIAGKEKKDRVMGPKEKRLVAYHEVGHALVMALQKDSEPVQKITIVPRTMGSLGYTLQTPEEEKYLNTKAELEARIVSYMAGRAAEEITCDSVTTGAANDIEQATKIARAMVTQFGMSEKFGLMGLESIESRYLDGRPVQNCGEATAALIDDEVKGILRRSYEQAKQMLKDNRDILEEITNYLYEHETITGKEFMDIFRRMKGEPSEDVVKDSVSETKENVPERQYAKASETDEAEKKAEDNGKEEEPLPVVAPAEAFEEDDMK